MFKIIASGNRVRNTLFVATVLGTAVLIPIMKADPVKKRTEVTFSAPTEIPGMVLAPGTYVMKVPDPVTHADMVGFYNPKESHLFKLVRTVPAYRTRVTDRTVITFEERANGAPEAIKTWFYPDDNWGREFVYGKAKTLPVAAVEPQPPAPAPQAAAAPAPATPAPTPAVKAPPVQIAQAQPQSQPQSAPASSAPAPAPQQLPKTASNLPLIFGAGAFLVLTGLYLRLTA